MEFDVYVIESARLDARQSVTLASELPSNSAKIVWLVEEGSYVEAGDVVARFDPAPFEKDIADLRREYQDGLAALAQSEAELQIQIRTGQDAVDNAGYAVRIAEMKLRNLAEADGPVREKTAASELQSAEIALQRALQEHATQQEMIREGFGSQSALEEARAHLEEKRSAVELAQQMRDLLDTVILPAEISQAELDVQNRKRELEHAEQLRLHTLSKQNNVLLRLRNQLAALEDSIDQAEVLLAQTEIRAPVSGFAIYKNIPAGNERRKAQVGDSVWNRHGFIVIPDMTAMVGHLEVREQNIGKLAVGQPVTLQPEAYPELEIRGQVDLVGTLVNDGRQSDENFFHVRIALDRVDERLRPGMRARASILTGSFTNVLRVPIESVFYQDGKPVCFVWADDETRLQPVRLGPSDGEYVLVEEGLEPGQQVLLSRPRQAFNPEAAD